MTIATVPRGIAVLCVAALALAGCGGGSSKSSSSAASTTVASTTAASSSAASTTESSTAATTSAVPSSPATTTRASTSASAAASGKPFTVTLPAGYKAVPSRTSGIVIAYYAGPIVGNFSVNVNVIQEPAPGLTLQTAQKQAVAGLKKALKITNLSAVSPVKIDGESALSYSFEDTQGGLKLKQGQVVVLHAGFAYVFTFTAPVAQFAKQSPKGAQLIRSVQFR